MPVSLVASGRRIDTVSRLHGTLYVREEKSMKASQLLTLAHLVLNSRQQIIAPEDAQHGECAGVASCITCSYTYDSLTYDADEENEDKFCVGEGTEHNQPVASSVYGRTCARATRNSCFCKATLVYWGWSLVAVERGCAGLDECALREESAGFAVTIAHRKLCCSHLFGERATHK